ncbi:MAG: D-alanyl-D-alanine carboxypeptidase/D-alanyl-D-alanine-endopeptidase [Spirosomataceae bacterium]
MAYLKTTILFGFCWMICHTVVAQIDTLALQRLQKQIDTLQNSPFLQNGMVGASVKQVKSGKILLQYQHQKSLAPASTMKLITTAAALSVLGESYRYQTSLEYEGDIIDGILRGNIYIKGTGDPSLGSNRHAGFPDYSAIFDKWIAKLKEIGIKEIQGSVIADASLFEENAPPNTWNWNDMGNYYGAGAFGLNVNENLFKVVFKSGKVGENTTVVRTEPELPFLEFINHVSTDKPNTGDQTIFYSRPYDSQVLFEGTIPAGVAEFSVKGSIPDPAYWLAYMFQQKLLDAKLTVCEEPTTVFRIKQKYHRFQSPKANVLDVVYSPFLMDLIKQCNFQSINLYAESFLKTLSIKLGSDNTTYEGIKVLKQIWQSKGIDLSGFNPKDGSGLSTVSSITADNMTSILSKMGNEPYFQTYYYSIPVLGESGTVRNLGKSSRAAGNVHAKSGSIEGVRAYAGYFTSKSGELYCFSFMLNRYNSDLGNATKALEKLMVMLADL